MKATYTAITLSLLLNAFAYGQDDWQEYKVDNNLTVLMPVKVVTSDSLGAHYVKAFLDSAVILVSRLPLAGVPGSDISSEEELIRYYKRFQEAVIARAEGKLIIAQIVPLNGLRAKQFSMEATINAERQIRHCVVFILKDTLYAVNFWELASKTEKFRGVREEVYSSLKIPDEYAVDDQVAQTVEGRKKSRKDFLTGLVIVYVFVGGLLFGIVVLVMWAVRRKSGR